MDHGSFPQQLTATPKDGNLLCIIAENPGMQPAQLHRFLEMADDAVYVCGVAQALLHQPLPNLSVPTEEDRLAAQAYREWVAGNRRR